MSAHAAAPVRLPEDAVAPPAWQGASRIGFGVGAAALVGAFLLRSGDPAGFAFSYLVAFLFFLTFALGGLFFVLLQYLTRAGWSVTIRRVAEHAMATLPLFAVLFLPIAFGYHELYHWSHADAVAADPILQEKTPYLNAPFFFARAGFYLIAWAVIATFFFRLSRRQDEEGGTAITRRLQTLSAPAMVVYAITQTFASFDWIMSLDPHWFSTIFGVYFFAGQVVAILAFLILVLLLHQRSGRLRGIVSFEHYHDLGKLLFGFVVFWAYIAFSQFMLIWYGNIPEETAWFDHRWHHGWEVVSVGLAVGHFGVPFLFLLSRDVKRRRATLAAATVWLLVVHYVDVFWLVMPTHHTEGVGFGLLDVLCTVGIGGLFVGAFCFASRSSRLVAVGDPRLPEALSFENA